jgi:hypothetical protein
MMGDVAKRIKRSTSYSTRIRGHDTRKCFAIKKKKIKKLIAKYYL